jgi:predicted negative regulator of RcsB-dependent stress response
VVEKKISRKELLNEPDEFFSASAKVLRFTRENPKAVITGIVIFVVCLAGVMGFFSLRKHQEAKSLALFDQGLREYRALDLSPEPPKPEVLDKVLRDFEVIVRDYGSLSAGEMALLYTGHVLYKKGDFRGALERYERMQSTRMARTGLEPLVLYHVAMTRFAVKDYDRAQELLTQLSKDTNSPYRREAFGAIARIYDSMGKNKEAAQAYRQYLKMFPEGPDAPFIRARLAEISAKA